MFFWVDVCLEESMSETVLNIFLLSNSKKILQNYALSAIDYLYDYNFLFYAATKFWQSFQKQEYFAQGF